MFVAGGDGEPNGSCVIFVHDQYSSASIGKGLYRAAMDDASEHGCRFAEEEEVATSLEGDHQAFNDAPCAIGER